MALYRSRQIGRYLIAHRQFYIKQCQQQQQNQSSVAVVDTLDAFTDQLIDEKSYKWEVIRNKKNVSITIREENNLLSTSSKYVKELNNLHKQIVCVENLSIEQVDNIVSSALQANDTDDISFITQQCVKYQKCPSVGTLSKLMSSHSRRGDKVQVQCLRELCKVINREVYEFNGEFNHYLAEATWISGNIEKGVELFKEVFNSHKYLRRKINTMVRHMVIETVDNRSEASLVIITNFGKLFGEKYNDYIALSWVWQHCFVSEWFSDQQHACSLLMENPGLQTIVANKVLPVTISALRTRNSEIVHRLLELLLAVRMMPQYGQVLSAFFNYKCWQGDHRGCLEIIKNSQELGVQINTAQLPRLHTLLERGGKFKSGQSSSRTSTPHLQFKF